MKYLSLLFACFILHCSHSVVRPVGVVPQQAEARASAPQLLTTEKDWRTTLPRFDGYRYLVANVFSYVKSPKNELHPKEKHCSVEQLIHKSQEVDTAYARLRNNETDRVAIVSQVRLEPNAVKDFLGSCKERGAWTDYKGFSMQAMNLESKKVQTVRDLSSLAEGQVVTEWVFDNEAEGSSNADLSVLNANTGEVYQILGSDDWVWNALKKVMDGSLQFPRNPRGHLLRSANWTVFERSKTEKSGELGPLFASVQEGVAGQGQRLLDCPKSQPEACETLELKPRMLTLQEPNDNTGGAIITLVIDAGSTSAADQLAQQIRSTIKSSVMMPLLKGASLVSSSASTVGLVIHNAQYHTKQLEDCTQEVCLY